MSYQGGMTLRLQSFFAGLLALLVAVLLALGSSSAKPASGGYQLFEPIALEHQHHIQLASLGNFDYFAKVASECCNAPNNVPNLVIDTKIQTQMADRGWSRQNIDDVIADGPAGRTTDNRRPNKTDDGLGRNDTATVYGSSGNYVIVNDRTGEIVQVSGRNDPNWIDDGRIQWD